MMTQGFAYEIVNNGAVIWRCFSGTKEAEIPEEIQGYPVTKLAPYAFSEHMNPADLEGKSYVGPEDLPVLCGDHLEIIRIPRTVTQVGRYCFYDCNSLKEIIFTDELKDWGSGAFTGCHHVKKIGIYIYKDGRTTLKDALTELPELMTVDYYRKKDNQMEYAKLVFPEFYEESIENTPARLINFEIHGSGMYYRNCFQQRVFQFGEYDSRFNHAGFQEKFIVVAQLVEGRLRYPLELAEDAKRKYEQFIVMEKERFSGYVTEKKEMDVLEWYVKWLSKTREIAKEEFHDLLGQMIEISSRAGWQEGLSYLMDYQYRSGVKKKRVSFDL